MEAVQTGVRATVFLVTLAAFSARAGLPEIDALAAAAPARRAFALPSGAPVRAGTRVHADERLGVPDFVWPDAPGPRGRAALVSKGLDAPSAARAQLVDLAPLWGLTEDDVAGLSAETVHDAGAVVVRFRQSARGVPVFREELRVLLDPGLRAVAVSGHVPSVADVPEPVFVWDADRALARVLADYGPGARALAPPRVARVLFRLPASLVPAWRVDLRASGPADPDGACTVVVSARDGALLYRHSWIASDVLTFRVWADAGGERLPLPGPQGKAGDPYPGTSPDRWQAPFVPPALVALAYGPIATRDPWLPPGATETRGNNVDAYADLAAPDGFSPGDVRADATAPGTFDRAYDPWSPPQASADQTKASVAQLFYTANVLHDVWYDAGFDERAGNAQASNYGRGGREGDALLAESQDYAGRNNANMTTPPDGMAPRMQIFLWDASPRRGLVVTSPASLARTVEVGLAAFGPRAFSVSGRVVVPADPAGPLDPCGALPGGAGYGGRIALVKAGACAFATMVANTQASGASAVVIASAAGPWVEMPDAPEPRAHTIPAVSVSAADGGALALLAAQDLSVSLVRSAGPDRDGALDAQVVAHEWGHLLSNRLVGDANGLSANLARGLGEGWSDFVALLLTVRAEDALLPGNDRFQGAYPLGGYVAGGGDNALQDNRGWYFGLRRYPYATDLAKDPLTYRHVVRGAPLPDGAPVAFAADGSSNAEAHDTGEVWATMLWECFVSLLNDGRLTFDTARHRMERYLVASLALTPVNPTLLEARDALLAAAFASDPDDHALFVRAFARRGAGPRATAGDRYDPDNAGGTESFDAGGDVAVVAAAFEDGDVPCDRDGRLDAGETGNLRIRVRNRGLSRLAATRLTLSAANPAVSFPEGASATVPATDPTQTAEVAVPVRLAAGTPGVLALSVALTLRDPGMDPDETSVLSLRANADEVPSSAMADDMETSISPWSPASLGPAAGAPAFQRVEITPFDHRWVSKGDSGTADVVLVSPPLVASAAAAPSFTFRHRHAFFAGAAPGGGVARSDGGVVEASLDGGATWTDVGAAATPAYGPALDAGPFRGRAAWSGVSDAWPAFTTETVTLGPAFQGRAFLVRFRRALAGATIRNAWEIDDVAFTNLASTPFPSLVPDRGRCRGRLVPAGTPSGSPVRAR